MVDVKIKHVVFHCPSKIRTEQWWKKRSKTFTTKFSGTEVKKLLKNFLKKHFYLGQLLLILLCTCDILYAINCSHFVTTSPDAIACLLVLNESLPIGNEGSDFQVHLE